VLNTDLSIIFVFKEKGALSTALLLCEFCYLCVPIYAHGEVS